MLIERWDGYEMWALDFNTFELFMVKLESLMDVFINNPDALE